MTTTCRSLGLSVLLAVAAAGCPDPKRGPAGDGGMDSGPEAEAGQDEGGAADSPMDVETSTDVTSDVEAAAEAGDVPFEVEGPEGARAEVPPGALAAGNAQSVRIDTALSGYPALPEGLEAASTTFAFTPHGQTFSEPVTVTVPLSSPLTSAVPQLLTAEVGGVWQVVPGATVEERSMRAQVDHFSFFVAAISSTQVSGVPSCSARLACGSLSCCDSIRVPGGTFVMGRGGSGSDACPSGATCWTNEQPEHSVSVSTFTLDRFEVTVGRFRQFVRAYDQWAKPRDGEGAHPKLAGSGWQAAWNAYLPRAASNLRADLNSCSGSSQGAGDRTWTDDPADHETAPITCLSWYTAFAFCLWDGGRLPTEAEWEFTAAGGSDNRLYPWGGQNPDGTRAQSVTLGNGTGGQPWNAVGAVPLGAGRWGHADLAGGVYEWTLDRADDRWYAGSGMLCADCANLSSASEQRIARGGGWLDIADNLRAAFRGHGDPAQAFNQSGVRCAR